MSFASLPSDGRAASAVLVGAIGALAVTWGLAQRGRTRLSLETPAAGGAPRVAEAAAAAPREASAFSDPNFPHDATGHTFHLGVARGDVAPRVLSVGDASRAARIATACFDAGSAAPPIASARGFVTHTGAVRGVRVSVIATGMGTPMMDFVVREVRAVVEGPLAIVRCVQPCAYAFPVWAPVRHTQTRVRRVAECSYGTCGGLRAADGAPLVVVPAEGSVLVRREPDAVGEGAPSPYSISRPVMPDAELTGLLLASLTAALGAGGDAGGGAPVVTGVDVTADSFYSSQGRTNAHFADANAGLVERVLAAVPGARCMQMETFHMLDLARSSLPAAGRVRASAAAIVIMNRASGAVADADAVRALEVAGGRACLEALVALPLGA